MANTPDISVIIPAFNSAPYIEDCLDSAIKQIGAPEYEIIVINDCSTDDTDTQLAKYSNIKVIRLNRNSGVSVARNTGILEAKGKYLYFLDSDDKIAPDALANLWKHVVNHPDINMVYGQSVSFPDASADKTYLDLKHSHAPQFTYSKKVIRSIYLKLPELIQNRLINRKWVNDNRLLFTPDIVHEDFDWQIRSLDHLESLALNFGKPIYFYRRRNDSITGSATRGDRFRSVYEILAKNIPDLHLLDTPVMKFIAHNLLEFKDEIRTDTDKELFLGICKSIVAHQSATRRHRYIVQMFKVYNRAIPLRPILFCIR